MLSHAIVVPGFPGLATDSSQMQGQFRMCNGTLLAPNSTAEGQDYLTLGTLLQGTMIQSKCGVDLDGQSLTQNSRKTLRFDGMELLMRITYTNTAPWKGTVNTSYEYSLEAVPKKM